MRGSNRSRNCAKLILWIVCAALVLAPLAAKVTPVYAVVADDSYSTVDEVQIWDALGGTDALGRPLADYREAPLPRGNRSVGVFYFLWHGSNDMRDYKNIYNNTETLAADPLAYLNPASDVWPDPGHFAYWAKPLFGYYRSDDAWVVRNHMRMLANADVDYVVLDTTNLEIYKAQAALVMRSVAELQLQGVHAPQVVFMTHTNSTATMDEIYETFYAEGAPYRYPSTWFHWQGKPLIIGENPTAKVSSFFTFRYAQWPNEPAQANNGWDWISFDEPQRVNYNSLGEKEQTSVSVAQNSGSSAVFSNTAFYNADNPPSRSRSYHDGAEDETLDASHYGYNFQEQWDHAIAEDPQTLLILEWNEWIAGNWAGRETDPLTFYDAVNDRWSRGIEPMTGGFGDNYYMQMANNIRTFKGIAPPPQAGPKLTIDLAGGFSQWKAVTTAYQDFKGDTEDRYHAGTDNVIYENRTGRNDIDVAKVARDDDNLYFYVRTVEALTPSTDANWMTLYLNVDGDGANGWEGYDYALGVSASGASMTLKKSTGGWQWDTVSDSLAYRAVGNQLMTGIPLALLDGTGAEVALEFKWVDNWVNEDNVMDFYQYGDAAPDGRMNYVYMTGNVPQRTAQPPAPAASIVSAPGDGWHLIEDADRRSEYKAFSSPQSSEWIQVNDPDSSGGTYSYLYNPSAKNDRHYRNIVRAGFEGHAVRWLTTKAPDGTEAEIFIDGLSQGTVNLYSTSVEKQSVAFEKRGLAPGQHEIMVVWLPQSGKYVHDAFEYAAGDAVMPEAAPGQNLAQIAHVEQSSFGRELGYGVNGAQAADGSVSTYWQAEEAQEQELVLRFGQPIIFDTVKLLPKTDRATAPGYELLYGDETGWYSLIDGGVLEEPKQHTFAAVTADRLMLRLDPAAGVAPVEIAEIAVYDSGNPGNGTTGPVSHWEFASDTEGWSGGPGLADFGWKAGGQIGGNVAADNVRLYSADELNIDLKRLTTVRLGLSNNTASMSARLYYTTEAEPEPDEVRSVSFEIKANTSQNAEYTLNLSELAQESGRLKQLIIAFEQTGGAGSVGANYVRLLEDTSVAAWKFAEGTEGWTGGSGFADAAWTPDGHIEGNVTGQPASLTSPDLIAGDLANVANVVLRLRNGTTATSAKLYFTTNTSTGFDEAKSVAFELMPSVTGFVTYKINMAGNPGWKGLLKQLRLVIAGDEVSGTLAVDEIRVEPFLLTDLNTKANWEFTEDAEGWGDAGGFSSFGWQAGALEGTFNHVDPQFLSPDGLWLDLKNKPFVTFGMKLQSSATHGTVYFSTLDSPNFTQGNSQEFALAPGQEGYAEYTLDMSAVSGWKGVLKRLRFDPQEGVNNGSFSLDYIRLQPYKIAPVHRVTTVGSAPEMPSAVTTTLSDGAESQASVIWEPIDPAAYASVGHFRVTGEVGGGEAYVTATVQVQRKPTNWEFTDSLEGWGNEFGISNFSWQEGGYIGGDVWYADAQFFSPDNLNLDLSGRTQVKIGLKNATAGTKGTFYFATDAYPEFSSDRQKEFTLQPYDDSVTEYVLDFSDHEQWAGTLKQIRFDPVEGESSGSFQLDYIRIEPAVSGFKPISVSTRIGTPAQLPPTVEQVFADGTERTVAVVWDTIDPSSYGAEGSFTVLGTVDGVAGAVKAVVTVMPLPRKAWDFTTDTEGWGSYFGISNFGWQEGGYVGGDIWYGDAQFFSPDHIGLDLTNHTIVKIKMKNATAATTGTFYFTTDSSPNITASKGKEFTLIGHDTGFTEYVLDFSDHPEWAGQLKQIRFDPTEGVTAGSFLLDRISIESPIIKPTDPGTDPVTVPGSNPGWSPEAGSNQPPSPPPKSSTDTTIDSGKIIMSAVPDDKGTAHFSVAPSDLEAAMKQDEELTHLQLQARSASADRLEIKLPASTAEIARTYGIDRIAIDTGWAHVSISVQAIEVWTAGTPDGFSLSVSNVDRASMSVLLPEPIVFGTVLDFDIQVGERTIDSFAVGSAIEIEMPYSLLPGENPDPIVVYAIMADGRLEIVRNGRFNEQTGRVSFVPTHVGQYASAYAATTLSDILISWARDSIAFLAAREVVRGTGNGQFKPEVAVTRAEFVNMLMDAFDLTEKAAVSRLRDVKAGAWYAEAVATAEKLGIVLGSSLGEFRPNATITRQDMAVLTYRTLRVVAKDLDVGLQAEAAAAAFQDNEAIGTYAISAVHALNDTGIMRGFADGTFRPAAHASRAEAATVIARLMKLVFASDSLL
ncbi:hypothetical protein PA598K_01218 [Paenibacillus sp. 598K]|uniref:S-layer homology domain-containing protein n=1 Tax=Paenibacillus sp. 598K TaxID=1117987 RepID=UPI000FF95480|nr:S-layer homology domain-containing protein [Paenibacillus sp. 598K]GBF72939.1 hypothetical protein PA598K_01218 [Paenibacillus sp. 598K]